MEKRFALVLTLLVLALGHSSASAKDWKKIRIGVEGAYPPFSSLTADGQLVGFDIDIAPRCALRWAPNAPWCNKTGTA